MAERNTRGRKTGLSRVNSGALKRSVSGQIAPNAYRMGRIRVAVRRAFIVSRGKPIVARDVLVRAYPRLKRFKDYHRWSVWRALRELAEVIARNRSRGRPNLWQPKSNCSVYDD